MISPVLLSNEPFFLDGASREGRAVLLLHGLGGGCYELSLMGRHLHQQGFAVKAINYPGHDHPTPRMPDSTWQQWYEHVEESWHWLSARYDRVSVVGFSTGCLLALHLAAAHPVERLCLLSPFLAVRHQWFYPVRPEAVLHSPVGKALRHVPRRPPPIRDRPMRRAARGTTWFRTFNLEAARSATSLITVVTGQLPSIRTPALIIMSRKDSVVDPNGADLLQRGLGSAVCQLHWLRHSDHVLPLDVEREEVFARTAAFLGDAAPPAVVPDPVPRRGHLLSWLPWYGPR